MSSNSDVEAGNSGFFAKGKKDKPPKEQQIEEESFYDSKLFRLISVIMYVCLVSGIGFFLALYHFFFFDSTMPPVANIPGHEVY